MLKNYFFFFKTITPTISYLGLFILIWTLASCNTNNESSSTAVDSLSDNVANGSLSDAPAVANGKNAINENLKYLFIPRDTFLVLANTRRHRNEKIAFQFAVENSATQDLTLGAYAQKDQNFSTPYFLEVGRESNESVVGKKVRFSTQKLIRQDVKTLVESLEDATLSYLLFKPAYDESNYTIYYVVFPITEEQKRGYTDPSLTISKIDTANLAPINTNPSPPASFRDNAPN